MGQDDIRSGNPLFTAALVVIVAGGLKLGSDLLVPIVLSAFLAMACMPIVGFLMRSGFPSWLAVLATIVLILAVVLGVAFLVVDALSEFHDAAPQYQARLAELWGQVVAFLEARGIELAPPRARDPIGFKEALGFVGNAAGRAASALATVSLVLLLTVFTLFESVGLPTKIRRALGRRDADLSRGRAVIEKIYSYIAIKTVISLITGALFGLALKLLGVDFYVLWGFLAFVLNFIPNIGSVLAVVPPILVALVQPGGGPGLALGALAANLAVNQVIGNVVEPKITGDRLGLSTLVVFISLLVWSFIWGPVGMLLSVPLTIVIKILLEQNPSTRPLAELLGPAGAPAAVKAASASR